MSIKLPRHNASLTLEHNEHLTSYQTVEDYILDNFSLYELNDWVSTEERNKAIDTNELWTLYWYPDTPVGGHRMSASSLKALLKWVDENLSDAVEIPT